MLSRLAISGTASSSSFHLSSVISFMCGSPNKSIANCTTVSASPPPFILCWRLRPPGRRNSGHRGTCDRGGALRLLAAADSSELGVAGSAITGWSFESSGRPTCKVLHGPATHHSCRPDFVSRLSRPSATSIWLSTLPPQPKISSAKQSNSLCHSACNNWTPIPQLRGSIILQVE